MRHHTHFIIGGFFSDILIVSTYTILPSIAGGLNFLLICVACGSNNTTQTQSDNSAIEPTTSYEVNTSKEELKELFQKWDTSTIEDSDKESIITKLDTYLNTQQIQNANDLCDISDNLSITSLDNLSLITYIETPEFYGESGKLSYTWVIYNNTAKLVLNGDSKEMEDVFQNSTNPNIYYVIGRDYSMTNCTGVFASEIILEDTQIEYSNDIIILNSNDLYTKKGGVLYGNSQLTIQKGNADGTQLIVKEVNEDSSLELNLTEDNCFAG